jgi:hypothetical protein
LEFAAGRVFQNPPDVRRFRRTFDRFQKIPALQSLELGGPNAESRQPAAGF